MNVNGGVGVNVVCVRACMRACAWVCVRASEFRGRGVPMEKA